jgi:hypothetical protein
MEIKHIPAAIVIQACSLFPFSELTIVLGKGVARLVDSLGSAAVFTTLTNCRLDRANSRTNDEPLRTNLKKSRRERMHPLINFKHYLHNNLGFRIYGIHKKNAYKLLIFYILYSFVQFASSSN